MAASSSRARRVPTQSRTGTKARNHDAAEEVELRDGVARLTLDAAAAQAGLSKGGVLYHFPTRDSLVAGMVTAIIDEFDRDIDRRLEVDREPGCFTRAYVGATMEPSASRPDREDRLGAALIAAAAAQPELLVPLQEAADRWQDRLERDGLDPTTATILRLACDGLWMCDLFGLAPPKAARRATIGRELDRLARKPS